MGCYDTVFGRCPTCNARFEVQSKAGACNLEKYFVEDTPIEIAFDLEGRTIECVCGQTIQLSLPSIQRTCVVRVSTVVACSICGNIVPKGAVEYCSRCRAPVCAYCDESYGDNLTICPDCWKL